MTQRHHEQLALSLQEAAASFVNSTSNRQSLITVTRTELSSAADKATFYVTVFPEEAEGPALGFLKRKRGECRHHMKNAVALGRIPHIEFEIDVADKSRRKVDDLLQNG